MVVSYFSSEALHHSKPFGLALIVSESPDVSMFDVNTQGDILASAIREVVKYINSSCSFEKDAAERAIKLFEMMKATGNDRCTEFDLKNAAEKASPETAELLFNYFDNKHGLADLVDTYIKMGEFDSAQRVSDKLGKNLSRGSIRKKGVQALAKLFYSYEVPASEGTRRIVIDYAVKAFDFLQEPMVVGDDILREYFARAEAFLRQNPHVKSEESIIFDGMRKTNRYLIDSYNGKIDDKIGLLHLANLALKSGASRIAHTFFSEFYKSKGKKYKNAVKKCSEVARQNREYYLVHSFNDLTGGTFPVMEAFEHAYAQLNSEMSIDRKRLSLLDNNVIILLNINVAALNASPSELDEMLKKLNELKVGFKAAEDVKDDYLTHRLDRILLTVYEAKEDFVAIMANLGEGIESGHYNYSFIDSYSRRLVGDNILTSDDRSKLFDMLTVKRATRPEPEQPIIPTERVLDDVLDGKLPDAYIAMLYRRGGLAEIKKEVLKVLDQLDGDRIARGYACLSDHNLGWLGIVEKMFINRKYKAEAKDYIAFAVEYLKEGNFDMARHHFGKAVSVDDETKKDRIIIPTDEIKPIIEPYREQILSALAVSLTSRSFRGNINSLISVYGLLDLEVPAVVHVREGMGCLSGIINYQGPRQTNLEIDKDRLYSAFHQFQQSGDNGMITFMQKNFPTAIAKYK